MIRYFVSLLFITLVISCNHQKEEKLSKPLVIKDGLLYSDSLSTIPFTGRHKSRMLDMSIEYEAVGGVRDGDFIIYFANKNIQMIGKMKNNKNYGEWKYYFPSGALQTTGFYENDIPNGTWIWYSIEGRVLEEGNFLNGYRDGEWKSYDSTGGIDIVRLYKDNNLIDSTKVR